MTVGGHSDPNFEDLDTRVEVVWDRIGQNDRYPFEGRNVVDMTWMTRVSGDKCLVLIGALLAVGVTVKVELDR